MLLAVKLASEWASGQSQNTNYRCALRLPTWVAFLQCSELRGATEVGPLRGPPPQKEM